MVILQVVEGISDAAPSTEIIHCTWFRYDSCKQELRWEYAGQRHRRRTPHIVSLKVELR